MYKIHVDNDNAVEIVDESGKAQYFPCLHSALKHLDSVGLLSYQNDYYNGLVFEKENVETLMNSFVWVAQDSDIVCGEISRANDWFGEFCKVNKESAAVRFLMSVMEKHRNNSHIVDVCIDVLGGVEYDAVKNEMNDFFALFENETDHGILELLINLCLSLRSKELILHLNKLKKNAAGTFWIERRINHAIKSLETYG
jgi:hypothetical protein